MRMLFSIVFLIWVSAPVFAQEPDWVRGKSKEYSDENYIVGVGSGDTRQDAESQARAHIAEVFKVNINANISVNKTETLKSGKGGPTAESKEVTRSRIDVGLKKTLEGTEIAEVWQNPKDATYYALAVLDREKALLKMTDRIHELDDEVVRLKQECDTTVGKVSRLRIMLLRKSLMADRANLGSDVRVVSPSGRGIEAPYSIERENSEIMSFLHDEFVIGIAGEGEGSDILMQTVTDMFTGGGFTIKRSGEKLADILVKIKSTVQSPTEPIDEWYYCRWHLELNAVDASDGTVILSSSENGKSGQLSLDESKKRAVFDMNKKITSLAGNLMDKLSGIAD